MPNAEHLHDWVNSYLQRLMSRPTFENLHTARRLAEAHNRHDLLPPLEALADRRDALDDQMHPEDHVALARATTDPESLRILGRRHPAAQLAVAANPATPLDEIERLAALPNPDIRHAAKLALSLREA